MPRLSNKHLRQRNNKGAHQRRRTTRGHRIISKFVKYKWYEEGGDTNGGIQSSRFQQDVD